ncbi:MAG: hypothetical protein NC131_18530 [Roseburia sp.]|nr:hypothetical protein [Roseburia sp.]
MTTPKHHPKRPFLTPEMQIVLYSETDLITASSGDDNEGEWDREIFR